MSACVCRVPVWFRRFSNHYSALARPAPSHRLTARPGKRTSGLISGSWTSCISATRLIPARSTRRGGASSPITARSPTPVPACSSQVNGGTTASGQPAAAASAQPPRPQPRAAAPQPAAATTAAPRPRPLPRPPHRQARKGTGRPREVRLSPGAPDRAARPAPAAPGQPRAPASRRQPRPRQRPPSSPQERLSPSRPQPAAAGGRLTARRGRDCRRPDGRQPGGTGRADAPSTWCGCAAQRRALSRT